MARRWKPTPLPRLPDGVLALELSPGHWEVQDAATAEPIGYVARSRGVYEAQHGDMIVARPRGFLAAVAAILRARRGH